MRLFYLLLLAHLLTDFVFQGKALAQKKKESPAAIAGHCLIFLLSAAILLRLFGFPLLAGKLAIVLLVLTAARFLIDGLKNYLAGAFPRHKFEWLIFNQALHGGAIFAAALYVNPASFAALPEILKIKSFSDGIILISIGYVLMWGGTHFVRNLLEKIPPLKAEPAEFNVGLIIGNLERILIFTLVLVDQYAAIGLVLAAKSIARFEDLKKREFAEYYLIGTLLSALIAIAAGIVVKYLIG